MADYDFSTLSPFDFEVLVRDLLQKHLSLHLESFKSGRDGGIDLRYSKPGENADLVVQAKHYQVSGYSSLKSHLVRKEVPKIKRLKPARYLLATSVGLSPKNKDELLEMLSPYCNTTADVFGRDDLNNLLTQWEDVERSHFKLWLPSTTVLQRLMHNGMFAQAGLELEEIKRQLCLFVPTPAVERGMRLLDGGFCMLTGIPGIGKTVTARTLVAHHLDRDWQAYLLSGNAAEAFDVYDSAVKQIFYYDDFLGQTRLHEKLGKNEDKQLLRLIRACEKDPNAKRLVLTTRDYLLQQAKQEHELINRSNIDFSACTIELEHYTTQIRAQILVNHLFFYGVSSEVCNEFVTSGSARKTLTHRNYNPRIVETLCELQGATPQAPSEFSASFLGLLDKPEEIWSHAYHNQLGEDARTVLLLFAIVGNHAILEFVKSAFRLYLSHHDPKPVGVENRLLVALDELDGSFISIRGDGSVRFLTYHTPAIKDFTDRQLLDEPSLLATVVASLSHEETLLSAISLLAGCPDTSPSCELVVNAMGRAEWTLPSRVILHDRVPVFAAPPSRDVTLPRWLALIERLDCPDAGEVVSRAIESFLFSDKAAHRPGSELVALHDLLAQADGSSERLLRCAARIADVCRDPDGFVSVVGMLERTDGCEEIAIETKERSVDHIYEWLDDLVSRDPHSTELSDAIDSAERATNALGNGFDDSDYRDRLHEIEEQEYCEHERYDEYFPETDHGEDEDEDEDDVVDGILDSLRE